MGLFSSIKNNFTHGNIKLELTVPDTVSQQDGSFVATVSLLNNGAEPRTILKVDVALVEDQTDQDPQSQSGHMLKEISKASEGTQFTLNPGESKILQVSVSLNFGNYINEAMPGEGLINQAASALGKLQTITDSMGGANKDYFVQAIADVDGITFEPSD